MFAIVSDSSCVFLLSHSQAISSVMKKKDLLSLAALVFVQVISDIVLTPKTTGWVIARATATLTTIVREVWFVSREARIP